MANSMEKVLIGKKAGMTRIFREKGEAVPVTAITSPDCIVVQAREIDGRPSIQVGFRETNSINQPLDGHFESQGVKPRKEIHEFLVSEESPISDLEPGDAIKPELFEAGDRVDVTGRTKGRGFTGVVKRWNFSGGPKSHGGGFGRNTGSIGQSADPSRVFPGKKMAGQYGNETTTMQNLRVEKILPGESTLLVSGSVPGADGWTLVVHDTTKGSEAVAGA